MVTLHFTSSFILQVCCFCQLNIMYVLTLSFCAKIRFSLFSVETASNSINSFSNNSSFPPLFLAPEQHDASYDLLCCFSAPHNILNALLLLWKQWPWLSIDSTLITNMLLLMKLWVISSGLTSRHSQSSWMVVMLFLFASGSLKPELLWSLLFSQVELCLSPTIATQNQVYTKTGFIWLTKFVSFVNDL